MLRIEFKQFAMRVLRRSAGNVMVNCGEILNARFTNDLASPHLSFPRRRESIGPLQFDTPNGFPPSRE